LFEFQEVSVNRSWKFTPSFDNIAGLQALWGYEALISDPNHYDALIEREPDALKIFYDEEMKQAIED